MAMTTKLQKWGNSLGLRFVKTLTEKYQMKEGTPVQVIEGDGEIIVRPIRRGQSVKPDRALIEWTDAFIKKYRHALDELAK